MNVRSLAAGALALSFFLAPATSMAAYGSGQSPVSFFLSSFIAAKDQAAAVVTSTLWALNPLVVTPQKGQIPLTVSATARVQSGASTCGPTALGVIDWGDGTKDAAVAERSDVQCGKDASDTIQHTFTKAGVYTITFTDLQKKTFTQVVQATASVVTPPSVVPRVDLKVNGSDGPVTISGSKEVTITWNSVGVTNCDIYVARNTSPNRDSVAPSGSKKITVDASLYPYVSFNCNAISGGAALSDYVNLTAAPQPSVRIISPNGGEKFEAGSGKSVPIRFTVANVPAGTTLAPAFVRQSDGHIFNFPGDNSCRAVKNNNGENVCTGTLLRTSGYDLGPGMYKASVSLLGAQVGEKDGPILATDTSDATFELTAAPVKPATISISATSVAVTPAMTMAVKYDNMPVPVGVHIINAAGTTVWTQELSAGGGGSTVVSLPSVLPDGYYRAQAFGSDGTVYATSAPYLFAATVTFKASSSSAQSIVLAVGQSISDGGIRITLSSVTQGARGPVANFTISTIGGASTAFSAGVGESSATGFTDTASPTGGVVFKISSILPFSRGATILISAVAKG